MELKEIIQEVEMGNFVFWKNKNYRVIKNRIGDFLIQCVNGHAIGLYGITMDGKVKVNADLQDFFVEKIN